MEKKILGEKLTEHYKGQGEENEPAKDTERWGGKTREMQYYQKKTLFLKIRSG